MKYCPMCESKFNDNQEKCPKCGISLVNESPIDTSTSPETQYQNNLVDNNSKNSSIFIIIGFIIALIIIILTINNNANKSNDSAHLISDVRCSYCGKVIRANGRNIHGTLVYNGNFLECEYCGHKTKITD